MSNECDHKWVFLKTIQKSKYDHYGMEFTRIDEFYCEKCLEERKKEKNEHTRGEEPEWFE